MKKPTKPRKAPAKAPSVPQDASETTNPTADEEGLTPRSGTIPARTLTLLTGMTDDQHRKLAFAGYFPAPQKGFYQTQATLAGLFRYFRETQLDPEREEKKRILMARRELAELKRDREKAELKALGVVAAPKEIPKWPAPGSKRPGFKRSTNDESEQRVQEVVRLIGEGRTVGQIKEFMWDRYGLRYQMALIYITRAREKLAQQETGLGRKGLAAEALAFYQGSVQNPEAPLEVRERAWEAIRKMLALDRPATQHVELTGKDGAPIETRTELSGIPDNPKVLVAFCERIAREVEPTRRPMLLEDSAEGNGNGNGHNESEEVKHE